MLEYLEIPVAGKQGSVKLVVYPQSSKAAIKQGQSDACINSTEREQARPKVKAKVFKEQEPFGTA